MGILCDMLYFFIGIKQVHEYSQKQLVDCNGNRSLSNPTKENNEVYFYNFLNTL